jgi:hypothetical protein
VALVPFFEVTDMAKKKAPVNQVFYNDRWVDKSTFRAFVYHGEEQKLANSYEEYEKLITSGLWFSSKKDVPKEGKVIKIGKSKHGAVG